MPAVGRPRRGPDAWQTLAEARRLAASVGSVEMEAAICMVQGRHALETACPAEAVAPFAFVCEYWLRGGHRGDDEEAFRLLVGALDRSGRTEAASALNDLIDTQQLTLRRLRDVVAHRDVAR